MNWYQENMLKTAFLGVCWRLPGSLGQCPAKEMQEMRAAGDNLSRSLSTTTSCLPTSSADQRRWWLLVITPPAQVSITLLKKLSSQNFLEIAQLGYFCILIYARP